LENATDAIFKFHKSLKKLDPERQSAKRAKSQSGPPFKKPYNKKQHSSPKPEDVPEPEYEIDSIVGHKFDKV
jgi:hypothetical protein